MNRAIVFGVAAIVVALVLGNAYKQKFREADRIVVTGLGEQEFTSDLIVWRGWVIEQDWSLEAAYAKLNANKAKVQKYIREKGIADDEVVFMFVNVNKLSESIYSDDGRYTGSKFAGYELRQEFRVESSDVEAVENISREISSLIAQGVQMEAWQPEYYYTKLGDLKLELIERATQDARERAEKIAENSKARLKSLGSGRMGVFQITGANMDEAYNAGGTFNTSSKQKKASITMRLEYLAR
jgi:hypothetical protein